MKQKCPPGGYVGAYVIDLAKELIAEEGDKFRDMSEEDALRELGVLGPAENAGLHTDGP